LSKQMVPRPEPRRRCSYEAGFIRGGRGSARCCAAILGTLAILITYAGGGATGGGESCPVVRVLLPVVRPELLVAGKDRLSETRSLLQRRSAGDDATYRVCQSGRDHWIYRQLERHSHQ